MAQGYDPFERWRGTLDEKTLKFCNEVGPDKAGPILADLEREIADNRVRNPSAYVTKSLSNLLRNPNAPASYRKSNAPGAGVPAAGGGGQSDASLAAWVPILDAMCIDQLR